MTKYWRLILEAILVLAIVIMYECSVARVKHDNALLQQEYVKVAEENGLLKATATTQVQAVAAMKPAEAVVARKIAAAGGKIAETLSGDVTIYDHPVIAPVVKTAAGETYHDEHERFSLFVTPEGLVTMDRHQVFGFTGTIYVGPDQSTRFADMQFREYSPKDGSEIPSSGVKVNWKFAAVKLDAPAVSPWHGRLVALATPADGFGLGGQINPWKGLIGSVGALYGSKPGLSGVAALGWRLRLPFLDSTLGVSGAYVYGKTGGHVAPAGSIEITR